MNPALQIQPYTPPSFSEKRLLALHYVVIFETGETYSKLPLRAKLMMLVALDEENLNPMTWPLHEVESFLDHIIDPKL
ncbi:MAG: hypothetical protein KDC34_19160 [Saprospiraceae bacterium]|nr:hypothetical protein [Saprospiraceae bacterium]